MSPLKIVAVLCAAAQKASTPAQKTGPRKNPLNLAALLRAAAQKASAQAQKTGLRRKSL
jgi:hypothetical protein